MELKKSFRWKSNKQIKEARQLSKQFPIKKAQRSSKNLLTIYKNERIEDESF